MKYLIHYKDQDGQTQELIKEFDSNTDFDTWETEQKSGGIEITEITNIIDRIFFDDELSDDELTMVAKNIDREDTILGIIRDGDDVKIEVATEEVSSGFTLVVRDHTLTIQKNIGENKQPHYFTREQTLMFMEMFSGKYLYAE